MARDFSSASPSATSPNAGASTATSSVSFGDTVSKMNSDMNFVGLFSIIYGALTCLSIVGALIGIPLIIMGLRLRKAAASFEQFDAHGSRDALRRAFEKQRSFFFINKVLIIIGIVFFVLYIAFIVFIGVGIFTQSGGSFM
jgi:beta-lactamase regulating signal transducer with metallopeptidase domain